MPNLPAFLVCVLVPVAALADVAPGPSCSCAAPGLAPLALLGLAVLLRRRG